MKNYVNDGKTVNITAAANHSSGDMVVTKSLAGVAQGDVDSGDDVVLAIEGVFRFPKNTSTAIDLGDLVDYDDSADEITKAVTPASGDVEDVGIAMETVASAGAFVNVKLIPGGGTFA
ncbi:MAG: DUF2190 family protein [Proteobacteria bacterium]|nr:DUF2190 family protein [Pseudomonadota bacterium]